MSRDEDTSSERHQSSACPFCGSERVEEATTVDLAFGEEIPCKVCKDCGRTLFARERD